MKYGYPREILADNDTSFTAEVFNEICHYFKIKITHGTPYKCSSTSKAERSNKRINVALRVTLNNKQLRDWDLYLNYITFALNSLKSRHTGFSANFMLFGRHLNTPLDLELNGDPVQLNSSVKRGTTAYQLYRTIRDICLRARRHAALDFGYADRSYNKKLHGSTLQQGDWVYSLIECPTHKFAKRWQGPFQITKRIDDHLYVVDLGSRDKLMNVSKLKKYVKSKHSPPQLNVSAPEFRPAKGVDNTTNKGDSDTHTVQIRDGMELDIVTEQDGRGHADSGTITITDTPADHTIQDTGQTNLQPAQQLQDPVVLTEQNFQQDNEDEEFEIITPPDVDPSDSAPPPPRRNPSRARNQPKFLQLFRGTKYYV